MMFSTHGAIDVLFLIVNLNKFDYFFQLRSLFVATCEPEVVRAIWDIYLLESDPFLVFFLILVMLVNVR